MASFLLVTVKLNQFMLSNNLLSHKIFKEYSLQIFFTLYNPKPLFFPFLLNPFLKKDSISP